MISTKEYCDIIKSYKIKINNIFEIGSLHGDDANYMKNCLGADKVYIFEAHPIHAENTKNKYPEFVVVNNAVTNESKIFDFNAVSSIQGNLGMSSLRDKSEIMENINNNNGYYDNEKYNKIQVQGIRMDDWINENNIENIDVCKIDVEGCSYECLEGFGSKINIIKFIHIECEHIECWKDQKLYNDVKELLEKNNFKLLQLNICGPRWAPEQQSDSIWINKNIIL